MSFGSNYINKSNLSNKICEQIVLAINGIRFGSVEIVIHDGKIVQIERKEKLRFDVGKSAVQTKP